MDLEKSHERPDWRNEKLGSRIRVALWLLEVIGEGNTFTKEQLHDAFPGITTIDRRLRELREDGWVIDSDRTLSHLGASEMLLTRAGEPIWEPGRVQLRRFKRFSAPQLRQKVLERDSYSCVHCGLSSVEGPTEAPVNVVLELAHVVPLAAGGSDDLDNLITLCANCHRLLSSGVQLPDVDSVWHLVQGLSPQDQARLLAWIAMDRKPPTQAEKAWSLYRRLRPEQRTSVAHRLGQAVLDRTDADSSD
ncbi:HNH endonuclease [Microbispora hainanensis]|uniref:HNH endonuclease n=1 Tax=Microbispora hainanensis TaxID=568844 RepID=A0A544Y519_9ACTN|nr:HNH endonuclease [Microbispora hainanensis]TQS11860.1 HNH endonuclease [Microbispora hainanensis]